MIYAVVTFTIPDSANPELPKKTMEWAKKLTKYVQSKWPEIEVELLTNYEGSQSDVHWSGKHESISAFEKFNERYNQDDGIKSLNKELGKISKEFGDALLFVNNRHQHYRIVDVES